MARIVTPEGVIVFTDYLMHPNATKKQAEEICSRLHNKDFGTLKEYANRLKMNGLKQIVAEESSENIIRHYGFVHHCAARYKTEALKAQGCT